MTLRQMPRIPEVSTQKTVQARCVTYQSPRKFEWLESEQDRIDDVLSEFPNFNSATNFADEFQILGGQNYREILYKLPDDKVEGVFLPPASHYDGTPMNTFGTIRCNRPNH
jgi:hypothetical protein